MIACLVLGGAAACVDDTFNPCADLEDPVITPDSATMWPPTVHTGYNGRDTFLAVVTTNFPVERWEVSNDAIVEVSHAVRQCEPPGFYGFTGVIRTKSAGTTRIAAVTGSVSASVDVQVSAYTVEETDAGRERYRTPAPPVSDVRPACASCHEAQNGVDHTPLEMAFHDDEALLSVSRYGHYPDTCTDAVGEACECGTDGCFVFAEGHRLSVPHEWDLTPEEADGIVAYLRALEPRGL